MKKIIYAITACLCMSGLYAQVTINSSDYASAGKTYMSGKDTTVSTLTIPAGGTSQTWDFSGLTADESITTTYYDGSFPGAGLYPACNLVSVNQTDTTFMIMNNNGIWLIIPPDPQNMGLAGKIQIMKFPLNYTDEISDSIQNIVVSTDTVFNVYDSLRAGISFKSNSIADAWGTLNLPQANWDCLRAKVSVTFALVLEVKSTLLTQGKWQAAPFNFPASVSRTYFFMSPNAGEPVAMAETDDKDKPKSVQYRTFATGILNPNISKLNLKIYPNPANDFVNLDNASNSLIRVYDVTGRQVMQTKSNEQLFKLDLSGFDKGIYMVEMQDAKGLSSLSKLIVQ